MAETLYTSVTWTAGDIITEAKMDNMVSNDQAVDAHFTGIRMTERADPTAPPANTLHLYVKDKNGVSALYFIDDSGTISQLQEPTPTFVFPIAGTLVVGASLTNALIATRSLNIEKIYAYAKTAPVGAAIICDVKKNSGSIWGSNPVNKITIPDGQQSANQTSFDTTNLAEGDVLSVDVNQVGSSTSGADLTIQVKTH